MINVEFFDCNVSYGIDPAYQPLQPVRSIAHLGQEMKLAGVANAVAWRMEQAAASPITGNQLLADDLRNQANIFGVWALLPVHTNELAKPDRILTLMKENRIVGLRLFPGRHKFMPRVFVLRQWLELAVSRRIPLFVNIAHGCSFDALADLLEAYPLLTIILTDPDVWPNDRMQRPFISCFPNVYLDLSYTITDGGIESFVAQYGSTRLLYGSDFPNAFFGSNMLMVRHANISQSDRENIASANMKRIIGEIEYD